MSADAGRPRYVANITDGNGRWARRNGVSVAAGHNAGADTVKARLRDAVELGVRELTVYSFSTENWSRPASEVGALMRMFNRRIKSETPQLREEGVRMRFIGRRELVKVARHIVEEGRVAVRNVRRDVMHDLRELKEAGETGTDDERRAEGLLQKLTDERIAELDALLKGKEAEILEV